ncbi:membrane protein [Actinomadura sp. NBRC 104412]|uniref:SpoIIE family protein phosphatase n=1 Tax=Actinomadura sp. NBRC 104412 TaxID=3032203 RepID=UPI0024A564E5|nr:SpoIIE family protein phosphatase [Actinomadura sp. NBRC 104412]GLZ02759.1 membrane protein [Actinomadura sp. NBRC 104412]
MATPDETAGGKAGATAGGTEASDAAEVARPAITVLNGAGRVVGWTRAAEALLGFRAEDILGHPGGELLAGEGDASRIWSRDGGSGDIEYRSGLEELRHRDGRRTLVHLERSRLLVPRGPHDWLVRALPASADGDGTSVLEPLLTRAPVVVAVWDRDLRCVWLNEGAHQLRDVFPYFRVGGQLTQIPPDADAPVPPNLIREVLDGGEAVIDRESRWSLAGEDEERSLSTFLFRVEGVDGRPLGVCLLAIDITHSMARERLALLREASVRVGTTLDVMRTAQELADLAVPGFADYVTVDLSESVLPGPEPLDHLDTADAGRPVFRRAALASIHGEVPGPLWPAGQVVYVPENSPFTRVLETGHSYLEPVLDTSPDGWLSHDPHRARVVHETGMHTLVIVPLKARGNILGVAAFLRTDNETSFTRDDQILAEELADRAALSLDSARQYTREHTAALTLQRHLLPSRVSGGDAMDVASYYMPSTRYEGVGGDWYDTIALPGSRVALVIGDVTGHGIAAAASMGRLRTAMRTLAYQDLPPDELLARLDGVFAREAEEEDRDSPIAATVLLALYDPAAGQCTMASAGHPPPALMDPDGSITFPDVPPGTPIGLGMGTHRSMDLDLAEGTLMVLYTDGLIERRESDLDQGMNRLGAALAGSRGPLPERCRHVVDTLVGEDAEDDVTLLLARTRAT